MTPPREKEASRFRRAIERYEETTLAYLLRSLEPFGLVIAVFAIGFAVHELTLTRDEIEFNRNVGQATLQEIEESSRSREETTEEIQHGRLSREATLFSLAIERLQVARELENETDEYGRIRELAATYVSDNKRYCSSIGGESKQYSVRAGQIPLLETLVHLEIPLNSIQLNDVNLVIPRYRGTRCLADGIVLEGAQLESANLSNSNLLCANLVDAQLIDARFKGSCLRGVKFKDADLTEADLRNADMRRADLRDTCLAGARLKGSNLLNADFAGANFTGVDLEGVDLGGADNLEEEQLDQACASGRVEGLPRKWKEVKLERQCPENPAC